MAISSSSSRGDDAIKLYERFINPQWVRLLAMRAGLASLDVLEDERLGSAAREWGTI